VTPPLWTHETAAAATGGTATRPFAATGVSIDTRTLAAGDLFVAIAAARDGHAFVADALARGAVAAMVAHVPAGVAAGAPLLTVPDTLAGLTALGAAARARSAACVVAVTGSAGKTSTKDMLRAILPRAGATHGAAASYNNHLGVPLTLARLPADAAYAVIEIGMNHRGEIAPLARLARPHVAVITTIAPAHLEALGSMEAIAAEKADIVAGLAPGGTAVLPAGLPQTPILLAAARAAGARVVTFDATGEAPADWRWSDLALGAGSASGRVEGPAGPLLVRLAAPGRHMAANALAALAAATAAGADPALAAIDLGRWVPPAGRGSRLRLLFDPGDEGSAFTLIDDAFNANPASLAAALDVLAAQAPQDGQGRIARGRRIAILGDMLELGPDEAAIHADVARHPAMAVIDRVHCAGPRMRALWDALPGDRRGRWTETAAELAADARRLADPGDVVLVKGSKGSRISLVVDAFKELCHPAPPGS
jgi:UDP-N-acetylmuramoyl-tripeptide--D-alanyl-D-alanine ligase